MNSKSKGSGYERDVARLLSKWVTGNDEELIYWRDSGSGSVSTIAKKKGKNAKGLDGDFLCVDTSEKSIEYKKILDIFFIDAKCLGSIHLNLINPKNQKSNQLLQEIIEVFNNAQSSNKIPFLIVKATNDRKIQDFIILPVDVSCNFIQRIIYNIAYGENTYAIQLIQQDDFFKINDWKIFIESNIN